MPDYSAFAVQLTFGDFGVTTATVLHNGEPVSESAFRAGTGPTFYFSNATYPLYLSYWPTE